MNRRSALQDTVLIGCCFLAFLAVVGGLIASAIGEPPVASLTNLFTSPLWLFKVAIALYFLVTGYRQVTAKSA
jgi:hypothetical protein